MNVELWTDPACPWSWAAYLWLEDLAAAGEITIVVHPFSLAIRSAWAGEPGAPAPVRAAREQSLRVLRVATQIDEGRTEFCAGATRPAWEAIARGEQPFFDVEAGLRAAGRSRDLVAAADDPDLDVEVERSMRSVVEVIQGEPSHQTIPVMALPVGGVRHGFLGPLFDPPPRGPEAVATWRAVVALTVGGGFVELSRPRARHSFTAPRVEVT